MDAEHQNSVNEDLAELDRRLRTGLTRAEDGQERFKGSPEKAAAGYARQLMESGHASAEDLSTMRFMG